MQKLKIAILRGGPSFESKLSLKSGKELFDLLSEEHHVHDILVDKKGDWYENGTQVPIKELTRKYDLIFNLVKGEYGEDGRLSNILEQSGVKYTGSRTASSMFAFDKTKAKAMFKQHGIKTPLHKVFIGPEGIDEKSKEVFNTMTFPLIVKPVKSGSSLGVFRVNSYDELKDAMHRVLKRDGSVIVEEFIKGKDASVFVAEEFRNKKAYSFIPSVYKNQDHEILDFDSRLEDRLEFSENTLSRSETEEITKIAEDIFELLELRHYGVVDFRVHPRRGVYALEANSVPNFHKNSVFENSINSVGVSKKEMIDHIIKRALGY